MDQVLLSDSGIVTLLTRFQSTAVNPAMRGQVGAWADMPQQLATRLSSAQAFRHPLNQRNLGSGGLYLLRHHRMW